MRLGAYDLLDVLGRGASGQVWKATYGDSLVAVKLLDKALSPEMTQMLSREVYALASLTHPHIVTVLDFGHVTESEASQDLSVGQPYVVFEYASRGALDEYLAKSPALSWPWVRHLLFALLDGLAHAHARNVIHRDLKPANIIGFENPTTWKITDFGLAFLGGEASKEHQIYGTPHYMAPEQFHGDGYLYAPHTDLYALGIMAYQLVCGRLPFNHKTVLGMAQQHLTQPVPPLDLSFPVPPELEDWIGRLLAKDVSTRFELAADAAASLRDLPDAVDLKRRSDVMFAESPNTLMETLLSTPTEISKETLPFGETHGSRVAELGRRPKVAPQPASWRRDRVEFRNSLTGSSARLFSLRARELVGRDRELDQLWTTLVQVRRTGRVRRSLITGMDGVGKTALATWFSERAAETGAATVVVLGQDPWTTMYRHARAGDDSQLQAQALGRTARELDAEDLLPIWLAENKAGEVGETALISYLRAHGLRRPLILVVDAIGKNPLALKLLERLTRADALSPHAVHVVATMGQTSDLVRLNEIQTVMRGADIIELQNLPRLPAAELLQHVLKFDSATADRLYTLSNGNPQTLFEVIEDWVDRAILTETPEGFAVEGDVSPSLGEPWRLRFEDLLLAPWHRESLIRAAILGVQVNWGEWAFLCRAAGISIPDDLVSGMVRRGLATWTGSGFAFTHGLMRDVLLDACDLVALNFEVAQALTELQELRPVAARWGRIGEAYMSAGRFSDALEPLLLGAKDANRRAHLFENRRLYRLRLECARAGTDAHQTALASVDYGRARRTSLGKDGPWFWDEIELARLHQWDDVLAVALLATATALRLDREYTEAAERASQAMQAFQKIADPIGYAKALRARADIFAYSDRFDESYRDYLEAQSLCRQQEDEAGIAWCDYGLGYVAQQGGDQAKALLHLMRAADWYRSGGHVGETASIENSVADTMFQLGRFDESLAFAESAIRQYMHEGANMPEAHVSLALASLALGDVERFKSEIVTVARIANHQSYFLPYYSGMAALDRDWEKWDEMVPKMMAGDAYRGVDLAIGYNVMVHCARLVEAPARAAQAQKLADLQWARLGRVSTVNFSRS